MIFLLPLSAHAMEPMECGAVHNDVIRNMVAIQPLGIEPGAMADLIADGDTPTDHGVSADSIMALYSVDLNAAHAGLSAEYPVLMKHMDDMVDIVSSRLGSDVPFVDDEDAILDEFSILDDSARALFTGAQLDAALCASDIGRRSLEFWSSAEGGAAYEGAVDVFVGDDGKKKKKKKTFLDPNGNGEYEWAEEDLRTAAYGGVIAAGLVGGSTIVAGMLTGGTAAGPTAVAGTDWAVKSVAFASAMASAASLHDEDKEDVDNPESVSSENPAGGGDGDDDGDELSGGGGPESDNEGPGE